MAVYTIVFSPTGGTKKAADLFSEAFCKDYVTIDLTERGRDFSKDSFVQFFFFAILRLSGFRIGRGSMGIAFCQGGGRGHQNGQAPFVTEREQP